MAKQIDFHINGNDPSLAGLKAMLAGVGTYMNDHSLRVSERIVVTVSTERGDVAGVLASLAKSGKVVAKAASPAAPAPEKRKYNTKRRQAESAAALDDAE